MERYYIKYAGAESNSYHVMDRERKNEWDNDFCLVSHLTKSQAIEKCRRLNDEVPEREGLDIFDINELYNRNGMLSGDGLMLLSDMHDTLCRKDFDRDAAIEYVSWNHRCHKDKATAMMDWALGILKREDK
jgi:hypothetical protein